MVTPSDLRLGGYSAILNDPPNWNIKLYSNLDLVGSSRRTKGFLRNVINSTCDKLYYSISQSPGTHKKINQGFASSKYNSEKNRAAQARGEKAKVAIRKPNLFQIVKGVTAVPGAVQSAVQQAQPHVHRENTQGLYRSERLLSLHGCQYGLN
jgi:hypothetical protein